MRPINLTNLNTKGICKTPNNALVTKTNCKLNKFPDSKFNSFRLKLVVNQVPGPVSTLRLKVPVGNLKSLGTLIWLPQHTGGPGDGGTAGMARPPLPSCTAKAAPSLSSTSTEKL